VAKFEFNFWKTAFFRAKRAAFLVKKLMACEQLTRTIPPNYY
jgi:hypothetical protein